jgi:hypothetical protein
VRRRPVVADTGNVNVETLVEIVTAYLNGEQSVEPAEVVAALSDLAARALDKEVAERETRWALDQQEAAEADRDGLARRVAELEAALRAYMEDHRGIVGAPDCGCRLCVAARAALTGDGGGA